jgi:hypothetical protein
MCLIGVTIQLSCRIKIKYCNRPLEPQPQRRGNQLTSFTALRLNLLSALSHQEAKTRKGTCIKDLDPLQVIDFPSRLHVQCAHATQTYSESDTTLNFPGSCYHDPLRATASMSHKTSMRLPSLDLGSKASRHALNFQSLIHILNTGQSPVCFTRHVGSCLTFLHFVSFLSGILQAELSSSTIRKCTN